MRNSSASGILKKIAAALRSMGRAKTLALKSKTRALKARLVVFSLLSNKKFLMSSMSHKLRSLLGHHEKHSDDEGEEDGDQSKAIVANHNNAMAPSTLPNTDYAISLGTTENDNNGGQEEVEEIDEYPDVEDDDKYPDLTHSLFDSEDMEFEDDGGSLIEMVKHSKEEAGEEFSLENEINHVADLFIRRFHKQIKMQKLESFKRYKEMLERSA